VENSTLSTLQFDLLGNSIWIEPEKRVGKEVIIKFLAAVAKEHNRGSINCAQRASRTAKSAPKPRGKLGPKPGTKRKRTETEVKTPSSKLLEVEKKSLDLYYIFYCMH